MNDFRKYATKHLGMNGMVLDDVIKAQAQYGGNKAAARLVGGSVAKKAQEKGITEVAFDRGGFLFHGRVKELADGAREAGLKF